MIEPLHIADTKRHLAEWQRRKVALLDFFAEFGNGRQITVSVSCSPGNLDPARGVFFARSAHPDAMKRAAPSKIVRARFESNGKVLATYGKDDLE
jgi:hypothetical protein